MGVLQLLMFSVTIASGALYIRKKVLAPLLSRVTEPPRAFMNRAQLNFFFSIKCISRRVGETRTNNCAT